MLAQVATVTTQHFSMDYCKFGQGAETLVVIPGLSAQSVMPMAELMANAYKLLSDDYTIYVFDRKKGTLNIPYTIKNMAEDTVEAIKELGLSNVCIFGASQVQTTNSVQRTLNSLNSQCWLTKKAQAVFPAHN